MLKNCAVDFYDYYNYYDFGTEIPQEFLLAILGGMMVAMLVLLAVALLFYIFTAVGLHTMANRRGIRNGWLAWLPFGGSWVLGSISDQYQYVAKGKIRNRRKALLGLEIAIIVVGGTISAIQGFFYGAGLVGGLDADVTLALVVLALSLVRLVVAVVYSVLYYVALYDLYTSSDPDNSVALLVLGIFLTFLQPFFIFSARKKELGMPPRKPVAPVPNTWQPPAEPVPAWQPPVQPAAAPVVEEPAAEEQTEE